ncbi:MAG: hypothetical protein ACM3MK_02240 [Chitinophagales bacterium]
MTHLQKVFLLFTALYFLAKGVIFLTLYIATKRIEKRSLVLKRKREAIIRKRWASNREKYAKQYQQYEQRKSKHIGH